jgi:hypothetical protein
VALDGSLRTTTLKFQMVVFPFLAAPSSSQEEGELKMKLRLAEADWACSINRMVQLAVPVWVVRAFLRMASISFWPLIPAEFML